MISAFGVDHGGYEAVEKFSLTRVGSALGRVGGGMGRMTSSMGNKMSAGGAGMRRAGRTAQPGFKGGAQQKIGTAMGRSGGMLRKVGSAMSGSPGFTAGVAGGSAIAGAGGIAASRRRQP